MTDFARKCVWIFGGSRGIGLACARQLSQAGADILILARDRQHLDNAQADLRRLSCRDDQCFAAASLDATDADAVRREADHQAQTFGAPNLVINCTGGAQPREFGDISAADFDRTLQQNLYSCRHISAAVMPHLAAGSHLVHTASLAGLIGVYGYTDYCAAKFAVVGFCEALRAEFKPRGIRVSVLCPPDTDTPGFATENLSKPEPTAALSAGARLLSAEQVAEALLSGIRRGRFLILPGGDSRLAAWLQRFAPALLRWHSDRVVRKTLVTQGERG